MKYQLSLEELMDFFCESSHEGFSWQEIERLEQRIGVKLPKIYRGFLLHYGRDPVNTYFNQLQEPEEILTSYSIIEESLEECDYPEEEYQQMKTGEIEPKDWEINQLLWCLPEMRWGEITENYLLIWFENQGVWSAGYRMSDLLSGNPDPPVYMSTEDDFITYQKCAENTEIFLQIMLMEAAYGWNDGARLIGQEEIDAALTKAQIDPVCLKQSNRILSNGAVLGTCLDTEQEILYFYWGKEDIQELYTANRTAPKSQKSPNCSQSGAGYAPLEIKKPERRPLNCGPYRPELEAFQKQDLGMKRPKPASGIALHPLIARLVQNLFHRGLDEPATAYDWSRDLARVKVLKLELTYHVARLIKEDCVYIYPPGEHSPPEPYYFDLDDWSIIRRMTNLQTLLIDEILIEDPAFWSGLGELPNLTTLRIQNTQVLNFQFLPACKNLRVLSLYRTNFSDCRLLSGLSHLVELDLRFCPLIEKEALNSLSLKSIWI